MEETWARKEKKGKRQDGAQKERKRGVII